MQLIKYAKHIPWLIMHNSFDIWQAKSPLNAYIPGRGGGGAGLLTIWASNSPRINA